MQLAQAFGECGWTGLKNVRRLDLINLIVTNGGNARPTLARTNQIFFDLPPAPRTDNHLRIAIKDDSGIDDSILRTLAFAQLRKDGIAAGDFDQFVNPANSGDERLMPFFE